MVPRPAKSSPRPPGRRLVIWRHGETEHNVKGIWQGQLDTPLSERGRAQTAAAAAALDSLHPTRILSSDLVRAAETARALAQVTGTPVTYDDRLREIHVGQWEGMSAGEIAEQFPDAQDALARGEDVPRGVDGETVGQVVTRSRAAVDEVLDSMVAGETVVVTTHGVTARALTASMVGMDQHTAWLMLAGLRNCHWTEVAEFGMGWRIVTWNVGVMAAALSTSDR